ncbi:MAG TPA: hypothetical protein VE172_01810 [Stackebrandtia sp.]|jgi:hypothetical protein|uniref:hypothetical protein n=1 Tax=Stackebrandtia sp. TaxID=2023065 RepID=UPI002D598C9D|nr:hypothetical protein [Stackebrandtia sp.]HZE37521.1 hypothetical protein [Stackebrandtia sp.]
MSFRDDLMHKVEQIKDAAYYKWFNEVMPNSGNAPPPSPEEAQAFVDGMRDLEASFEYFTGGDPDSANQMIEVLAQAKQQLTNGIHMNLSPAATHLNNWSGNTATTFRDRFFTPFQAIAVNQANVVEATSAALHSYQEILRHARQDIVALADKTIGALQDKNSGDILATIVGLGSSIAGAAVTIASGGAMAPAMFSLLSAGAGAAPKLFSVGGSSTKEILDSLRNELRDQRDRLDKEINDLKGRIDHDLGVTFETTVVGGDDRYPVEQCCPPSITAAAVADGSQDGRVAEFTPPEGW